MTPSFTKLTVCKFNGKELGEIRVNLSQCIYYYAVAKPPGKFPLTCLAFAPRDEDPIYIKQDVTWLDNLIAEATEQR